MSAPPFPALRSVQTLLWRLIAAPEGVAAGAATLRREGALQGDDLSFLVRPDERMDATERLDVYADMYFYRLRDCLAEDFPKVETVLGADHFHNLATDYLLAHPPAHFSLRELGRALPDFLATHGLAREFADIADLARLEWARVDVFDEADTAPLTRDELLEKGAAAPETFGFGLVPATRLLQLAATVLPRWKRIENGDDDVPAAAAPQSERGTALVWRRGFGVAHRSLPAEEAVCLDALREGPLTVARLAELVLGAQPPGASADDVPMQLAALLERWSADEILREVSPA